MPLSADRWKEVSPSQFAWEREALDFIRQGLPDCEPYRAWSNFEFVADDGSINEVDVLIFTPQGFFLVEIKSRPGVLAGDAQTWLWTHEGRETAMDNPLFLANRKSKKLKALLSRQKACRDIRFPFVDALVFCSSADLDCRLQGTARLRVCLRDSAADAGRPARAGILAALRRREADGLGPTALGQFDAPTARAISRAMEQAGIRQSQRARRVGDYRLAKLLFENPLNLYQDWEAEHFQLPASKRFVRLYLAAASSSSTERETLKRAARREYEILDNLRHQNILLVQQYTEHESGPALIFEHDPNAVRLDHFLAQRGAQLSIDTKLDLVRQLAEALKFAHDKHAIHGALSPQSVLVFGPDSPSPRLKLYNWQTAFRTASTSTSGLPQISATVHPDVFWEDASRAYLAPELVNDPTLHGEHLDVFSLGAIAYHIFSGQPPAGSLELAEKLRRDRGLKLSSVLNGAGEELQMLVEHSTHPEVTVRLASVDEFLEQLARVEEEFTTPSQEPVANPADAKQNDRLQGGFLVKQRFGSGSAAIVFLVEKGDREMVLKLANKPENNSRILDEYDSLAKLGHPSVVRVYDKVIVGGLQGFTMQRAGELTLAQRLSKEGRLSLELLERFGEQLLESVNYLDQEGVSHRDVKPENLGIGSIAGGGKLRLVLFDFSLARTPADNIRAGTPPYLEPFLSLRRPKLWDTHAERYAVAVTLYQMATGQRPVWGDGMSDPAQLDCEVTLDAEKFDAVIREPLLEFFRRALKRDFRQRFDNAQEMLRGWRKIFEGLDQPSPITTVTAGGDQQNAIATALPETNISLLGLTPRAIAAIDRLGATTVKDFLAVPLRRAYRLPGSKIRREVVEAFTILRARFPDLVPKRAPAKETDAATDLGEASTTSIDVLVPEALNFIQKRPASEKQVFQCLLGLNDSGFDWPYKWPAAAQVASGLTLSRGFVDQCLDSGRQRWSKTSEITALRETIAGLMQTHGGVMTVSDLSLAVLTARGSTEEEPVRSAMASAVTRAALETESNQAQPRFLIHRREMAVLVAQSAELADYAVKLGEKADELAALDPLPNPIRVVENLRGIDVPPGAPPLPESTLVAKELKAHTPATVLAQPPGANLESRLVAAHSEFTRLRERMIALQEELDWECYRLYRLLADNVNLPPTSPQFAQIQLRLGERAFEIVMAKRMAQGELETAWFNRHGSTPIAELPTHWPASYRELVERRIALIENDSNIALIEQPEYKRRWNTEPWEEQQERALREWLLERLEDLRYWPAVELTSCAHLADKVRRDAEFMEVAALYSSRPDFGLTELVVELVESEAVPFLPVLRYKESGLRKRAIWEQVWDLQRREDAIEAEVRGQGAVTGGEAQLQTEIKRRQKQEVGDIPVPPKYDTKDFVSTTCWRLRGKLDVPKERFITYPHCNRDADRTPVIGWAGWDHLQQAQAVAGYYERTHMHSEGVAGAVAIAVAAAMAWRLRGNTSPEATLEFFNEVHKRTPDGETRQGIGHAFQVRQFESPQSAARTLGNGSGVTCPDTVPFTMWAAAKYLGRYREAIAATASVGGDVDTNCAIVGGIVSLSTGRKGFPEDWLSQMEKLPYPASLIAEP